jgi:hypothetical protein
MVATVRGRGIKPKRLEPYVDYDRLRDDGSSERLIIRAKNLRVKDQFIKQGIKYKVKKIEKGKFIIVNSLAGGAAKHNTTEIGIHSQERVELIIEV